MGSVAGPNFVDCALRAASAAGCVPEMSAGSGVGTGVSGGSSSGESSAMACAMSVLLGRPVVGCMKVLPGWNDSSDFGILDTCSNCASGQRGSSVRFHLGCYH